MKAGRTPTYWLRRGYVALVGLVVLGAIAFLAVSVAEDLQNLESARSDNLQWSVTQTEVEFLEFSTKLGRVAAGKDPDLAEMRKRFDIFYSRIATIETAAIYQSLLDDPDYATALAKVRGFLDQTVPLIDADDARLLSALPVIETGVANTRPALRTMTTAALHAFTVNADQRRAEFAQTLIKLAFVVIVLIAALGAAVFYLRQLNAQRTQRQNEVEETAARMDTVIQTSLDGVIVADEDGHILAFNTAAEAIFGHMAEDVLGKSLGPLIVPDHMLDAHDAGMARMRAGGEKRVVGKGRVQLEAKHSDGSVFPVELAIQTAETKEGTIFVAFLRDISASVQAEAELISTRDRALAADRLKTEFLATMSHEIRTPLNGLLGNLTLLQDTKLNPSQLRYTRNMETSGDLLLQHVTDVLNLSRYDVGHVELRDEPLSIATLVQSIVDSQSGLAAAKNTTIELDWIGPPQNWVRSDPDALQHILMNLVGNAVKFTPDGKVSVTVAVADRRGDIADVIFRVTDTGQGIDDDLKERIFDDFVTGTIAYDRDVGGTGLGLGIVRRSVAALAGQIEFDSAPGLGSTFEVRLPLTVTDPIAEPRQPASSTEPLLGLRILVVEDNEINRAVAREMLRADGRQVEEAHDGKVAVAIAAHTPFDLILMDISMPVMDGRTATRAIRNGDGACATVPIIALTANAMASEQAAFLEDGMNGILIKPLSRTAMRAEISKIAAKTLQAHVVEADTAQRNEMRDVLGEDAYAAMTARFVAEAADLHQWLQQDPLPALGDIAHRCHKVAGSAGVFSADAYRAALLAVEDAAKAGDISAVIGAIGNIKAVWDQTEQGL
ncbi:ATP-binding protein [Yoonia sp. SS1-5]|uniref:histidine kinase n=1 Tax=Yoonia rhodophyticola TaxID=3137370 RepID=A0AAN0MAZ9_9RHOB